MKLGDLDKKMDTKKVSTMKIKKMSYLRRTKEMESREKVSMPFTIPMFWHEPWNHVDDSYFCVCDITGYNTKNKKEINYPNLLSAKRPVSHGPGLPVPSPLETFGK